MQRCSRGSVESAEQPRQERKPAARMNVSSKHRRASRGVDRSATTSSITSVLDHEAEAGTTVKNNVTVATLNKCWKAMVTFWRNELSHGPHDDECARRHAIRLIDIFGFHRDCILNCLGDLTELRLLHVDGREAAVRRLTDTLIGKRNMIKTPAFETIITSVRSRFPELVRDLEARVDENIQFVQTTVIDTIDMALADFNSLQSEPEEESKVETGGVDSNLLYEPTADEVKCEEEMQGETPVNLTRDVIAYLAYVCKLDKLYCCNARPRIAPEAGATRGQTDDYMDGEDSGAGNDSGVGPARNAAQNNLVLLEWYDSLKQSEAEMEHLQVQLKSVRGEVEQMKREFHDGLDKMTELVLRDASRASL